MHTKSYAIEKDAEKRLTVTWQGNWKDVTIAFDGQIVGVIPNRKALSVGNEMALPDGSQLKVKLAQNFFGYELQLLRNDKPLPGSSSEPSTRLKLAYQTLYFIASLNLFLGVITLFFQIEFLQMLGVGGYSVVFGLVFMALAFFTQRESSLALIIAVILFALDGIVGFIGTILAGHNPGVAGLFVRVLLIIPMIQGIGAIKALKQENEQKTIAWVK